MTTGEVCQISNSCLTLLALVFERHVVKQKACLCFLLITECPCTKILLMHTHALRLLQCAVFAWLCTFSIQQPAHLVCTRSKILGASSLFMVGLYPLMKRVTHWVRILFMLCGVRTHMHACSRCPCMRICVMFGPCQNESMSVGAPQAHRLSEAHIFGAHHQAQCHKLS